MMASPPHPEAACRDDFDAVVAIVREAGLPTAGIGDAFPDGYVVIREGGEIIAVAGLERHGPAGLLRSVAVRPEHRRAGRARLLVDDRLEAARQQGLDALYLLTTTAGDYFRRLGFREASRNGAPDALRASSEFASLCPASAVCLAKELREPASFGSP